MHFFNRQRKTWCHEKHKRDCNARGKSNILDLHPLTTYAAQRGVGFDFGFNQKSQTENGDSYPPLPSHKAKQLRQE